MFLKYLKSLYTENGSQLFISPEEKTTENNKGQLKELILYLRRNFPGV